MSLPAPSPPGCRRRQPGGDQFPSPANLIDAKRPRGLTRSIPGFPGAHSQGETLDELQANLQEVIAMLLEDGEPVLESDFVGLQQIVVPA